VGTELPLLLQASTLPDLPVLDTTELHVQAIVRRLRSDADDHGELLASR
jgi:aspartate/glutamate racemase